MIWLPPLSAAAPLIAAHPHLIEIDLQRFYHIDYRDRWREGSALSYRRLLALLDGLPPESLFRSTVYNTPGWSQETYRLTELWESLAGQQHPERNTEQQQAEREEQAERDSERERQRAAAREHNRRVLAAKTKG